MYLSQHSINYIRLHDELYYFLEEPLSFPLMKSRQAEDKGSYGDWEAGMGNQVWTQGTV